MRSRLEAAYHWPESSEYLDSNRVRGPSRPIHSVAPWTDGPRDLRLTTAVRVPLPGGVPSTTMDRVARHPHHES